MQATEDSAYGMHVRAHHDDFPCATPGVPYTPHMSNVRRGAHSITLTILCGGCITLLAHCGYTTVDLIKRAVDAASNHDDPTSSDTELQPSTVPAIEASSRYALALGGVAPGRNELVLLDANQQPRTFAAGSLALIPDDTSLVSLTIREGFNDFSSGSGAILTPLTEGSTKIHAEINGAATTDTFATIVPPQSLVQILLGEARGQILNEATISDGVVALTSRSVTGDALAAVVRNRVELTINKNNAGLFAADHDAFFANLPTSGYNAIIAANSLNLYQFSPVHPDDPSHETFDNAQDRNFLSGSTQLAYDQAVLTATGIFDGTTKDPTNGAFAFRTPTTDEWNCIKFARDAQTTLFPTQCISGDENFPALAPVQLLLLPNIAKLSNDRDAFVFYRTRRADQPAVSDMP